MSDRIKEDGLVRLLFFVGPSLRGHTAPVEVFLDPVVRCKLQQGEEAAWQAVLSYVEEQIALAE